VRLEIPGTVFFWSATAYGKAILAEFIYGGKVTSRCLWRSGWLFQWVSGTRDNNKKASEET
jgi:hypothetical protein